MRTTLGFLIFAAASLVLFACATAPPDGQTPLGGNCILVDWDFKSMQAPPPELAAQTPQDPLDLRMPSTFTMQHPPVTFSHASHATLPCDTCHTVNDKKLFTDIDFVKTCPHTLCMGCHQQMVENAMTSGPVSCEGCHVP